MGASSDTYCHLIYKLVRSGLPAIETIRTLINFRAIVRYPDPNTEEAKSTRSARIRNEYDNETDVRKGAAPKPEDMNLLELENSISDLLDRSARKRESKDKSTTAIYSIEEGVTQDDKQAKTPRPIWTRRSSGSDGEKKQGRIKTFDVADIVMLSKKLEFSQNELINLLMQVEDLANIGNTTEALATTGQLDSIFLIATVMEDEVVKDKWIVQAFRMAFIHSDFQQAIRLLSEYSLTVYLNQREVVSAAITSLTEDPNFTVTKLTLIN